MSCYTKNILQMNHCWWNIYWCKLSPILLKSISYFMILLQWCWNIKLDIAVRTTWDCCKVQLSSVRNDFLCWLMKCRYIYLNMLNLLNMCRKKHSKDARIKYSNVTNFFHYVKIISTSRVCITISKNSWNQKHVMKIFNHDIQLFLKIWLNFKKTESPIV